MTSDRRLAGARCILLPRTRYQVYCRTRADESAMEVIAFWQAGRGTRP